MILPYQQCIVSWKWRDSRIELFLCEESMECLLVLFSNSNCFIFYSQIGNDNESEHMYIWPQTRKSFRKFQHSRDTACCIDKGQNDNQMRTNILVFRSISPLCDEKITTMRYPHPSTQKALSHAYIYH